MFLLPVSWSLLLRFPSLSTTSCCLLPSVFSSTFCSCHPPPLSFCLPFSTLICHYQRCHVREWVFWGSRGMWPAKSETTLWNIYMQIFASHTFNTTYKAIHLQDSRCEVSSVFMVCLSDLRGEKKLNLLKHNVAPWWMLGAVQILCRGFLPLACCPLQCSHSFQTVWAWTVKYAPDLKKILYTEVASKGCRHLFVEADGLPRQLA